MTCKIYCPTAIEQEIGSVPETGYAPYFFPVEGAWLPFFFTQETFLRVFSSLANGSQFTYGDEGRAVLWEFLRNVEYPMSICDQIITCIQENPATRAAIVDALKNDPDFNQWFKENVYRLTGPQIIGPLVAGDCDNAVAAGRALAVVNRLAANAEDFLEVLEVGTNDEERVSDLLEGIPIFGELPVGDVINFLQDLLEDFGENFSAANTTGRREELARLVWCRMLEDPECTITFEGLFEVLQERAVSGLDIASVAQDVIEFITDGDFNTDDAVFYGLLAAEVAFVLNSRDFYGVNIGNIGVIMKDAEPSSIWETWDPCVPVEEWWFIDYSVSPSTNNGVVTAQTATTATVTAQANGDSIYRCVFNYASYECFVVSMFSVSPGADFPAKVPCGGSLTGAPVAVTDNLSIVSYASLSPFSISIERLP